MFRASQRQSFTEGPAEAQPTTDRPRYPQPVEPGPTPVHNHNLQQFNQHIILGVQAVNRFKAILQLRNS